MRTAFITDIHANREALEAVLDDIDTEGVDRIVCLGDIVGYGPDPVAAVDIVAGLADRGAIIIKGNHDHAVDAGWHSMSENAARAMKWTAARLGPAEKTFLADLPLGHREGDALFVHASAHNPESWPYVLEAHDAAQSFAATDARLIFSGHTHVPALFHTLIGTLATGKMLTFRPVADKPVPLSGIRRYHAVIGAVGQPRDRDSRACWGLWDDGAGELTWRRVPYDVEATVAKVQAAGLPDRLWMRLLTGD
ncbi:metallophosphoesterase family protein [Chthonobacter rhizosphaerae]|uniref:metallophosphoesterase family protein n=1 Tax=Chthonobacter rhizosphaerae TaxID=2735553 RepID=UPI001AEE868D